MPMKNGVFESLKNEHKQIFKFKGVNKIMENEKSVYEILQEQIERQDKIINKLIKTNVIIVLILAIVMCVFTISYFWSDYDYQDDTTTITGDNNNSVKNNDLTSSKMNLK